MTLVLRERDKLILKEINDAQALDISHIRTMFFNSKSRAYDRISQLCDEKYIQPIHVSIVSTNPTASRRVFAIAPKGAAVLMDVFGCLPEEVNYPNNQVKYWRFLRHLLAINTVRAAIYRMCADRDDAELITWRNEKHFRGTPTIVQVKTKQGLQPKEVQPDGYCVISTSQGKGHFFIEADTGSEGREQLRGQIEVYRAFIESGTCERLLGTNALTVLAVTNSKRRIQGIVNAIEQAGVYDWLLFSTFDQIMPTTVLHEPIWYPVSKHNRLIQIFSKGDHLSW
jgi:hypothetical protein